MAYVPYTWKDGNAGGTPLTADRFNAIEQGIKSAADVADAATAALPGKASAAQALPAGGGAGQLLVKNSSADYAVGWQTPSTTVAAHTHPQSQIDNLSSDLNAIRLGLFGGSSRTKVPFASVYMNADAGFAAATDTVFASGMIKEYDSDTIVTLGTGQNVPTELTAPVAGMYLIEYHVMTSQVTGQFFGRVILNGTNTNTVASRSTAQSFATQYAGAATEASAMHLVVTRALAAGDRLQFGFYGTTAGTLKAGWFGGLRNTRMAMRWVSPSA